MQAGVKVGKAETYVLRMFNRDINCSLQSNTSFLKAALINILYF